VSENYAENAPKFPVDSCPGAPPALSLVLIGLFRPFAVKEFVATEATAVYCRGREAKMEIPEYNCPLGAR